MFFLKLCVFAPVVLWVGLIAVGIVANTGVSPLPAPASAREKTWMPLGLTWGFYSNYFTAWKEAPEGCVHGEAYSEFQKERCSAFWNKIGVASAIGVIPFGVLWLYFLLGMDSMRATYRRVRRAVDHGPPRAQGVVTNPPVAPNDFYGWLYGFRMLAIQLPNHKQVRIHFSREAQVPLPGDKLMIFSAGKAFGRKRYFGVFYAPHIAVIPGARED
jgi:hypothetical protein